MDIRFQLAFVWTAVALYAIASVLFICSQVFKKPFLVKYGVVLTTVGFISHTTSLVLRWIQVGHGPYLSFYEVASSCAWAAILMYLLFQAGYKNMRSLGAIVTPLSFLLIGLGVMSSGKVDEIPPTFRTFWLIVHVFFGKITYGSILLAFGMSVVYLIRYYFPEKNLFSTLPANEELEKTSYKMFILSFIIIGIMIASGSIWANQAWGRYWGWDPVESWSLISWLLIGIYLHLKKIHGWQGVRAAWLAIIVFLVVVFSIFGVVYLYHSIHSEYVN